VVGPLGVLVVPVLVGVVLVVVLLVVPPPFGATTSIDDDACAPVFGSVTVTV
jgi:hypothetical protein